MYSNYFKYKFEGIQDREGLISKKQFEYFIRDDMGYAFNRKTIDELVDIGIIDKPLVVEKSPSRQKYTKHAVVEALIYLIVAENIPGMLRSKSQEERDAKRENIIAGKCSAAGAVPGFIGYINSDTEDKDASCKDASCFDINFYVKDFIDYIAELDGKIALAEGDVNSLEIEKSVMIDRKHTVISFVFLFKWFLLGEINDFVSEWEAYRDYVLLEVNENHKLPLINKYKQSAMFFPVELSPISKQLNRYNNATIDSSIDTINRFVSKTSPEGRRLLMAWMEIILCLENGKGWIIAEAQEGLRLGLEKLGLPQLDQSALIDDWWLLSFIYVQSLSDKI